MSMAKKLLEAARRLKVKRIAGSKSHCALCGAEGFGYTVEGLGDGDGCVDACPDHVQQVAADALEQHAPPSAPQVVYAFKLGEEDIPVRGNAMASGDAEADKAAEDEIIRQLDRGNLAAWCYFEVTATLTVDGETFKGSAGIGGCSYESEADIERQLFTQDEYALKGEALDDLRRNMRAAIARGTVAAGALKLVEGSKS